MLENIKTFSRFPLWNSVKNEFYYPLLSPVKNAFIQYFIFFILCFAACYVDACPVGSPKISFVYTRTPEGNWISVQRPTTPSGIAWQNTAER
jgi:hypothetical protein